MNKKSKGTTLVEIMISVILISIVMVFLFNILVDLKDENELTSKRSTDSINRASYTRIIQNDLINYGLKGISNCNEGIFCLNFLLDNNVTKKLVVNASNVIYEDERWELVTGNYIRNDIKLTYKVASVDQSIINKEDIKNYHLLKIIIPVTKNISSNRKYDIEITNVSDKALILDCNKLSDYIGVNNVECTNA